jgi:hypothetical protein
MNCQLPPPLKQGDLLRLITPSGALREWDAFNAGVEIWRSRGYEVEVSEDVDHRWGYLLAKTAIAVSIYSTLGKIQNVAVFSVLEAVTAALEF